MDNRVAENVLGTLGAVSSSLPISGPELTIISRFAGLSKYAVAVSELFLSPN